MHCATFPIFLYVFGQPPLNRHTAEIAIAGIKMCLVKKELTHWGGGKRVLCTLLKNKVSFA